MAVINEYVDSDVAAEKFSSLNQHKQTFEAFIEFEIAAADDDGSIYRLLRNVPGNLILAQAEIWCDAITGATDVDLGLYKNLDEGGAALDADVFADGFSLASAKAYSGAGLFGMQSVDIADVTKRLYEHAGHTISNKLGGYDIALTANTVGSAAGTVLVRLQFIQG